MKLIGRRELDKIPSLPLHQGKGTAYSMNSFTESITKIFLPSGKSSIDSPEVFRRMTRE
jgi:hypothetical protein